MSVLKCSSEVRLLLTDTGILFPDGLAFLYPGKNFWRHHSLIAIKIFVRKSDIVPLYSCADVIYISTGHLVLLSAGVASCFLEVNTHQRLMLWPLRRGKVARCLHWGGAMVCTSSARFSHLAWLNTVDNLCKLFIQKLIKIDRVRNCVIHRAAALRRCNQREPASIVSGW